MVMDSTPLARSEVKRSPEERARDWRSFRQQWLVGFGGFAAGFEALGEQDDRRGDEGDGVKQYGDPSLRSRMTTEKGLG
jgi:hypothetical protein